MKSCRMLKGTKAIYQLITEPPDLGLDLVKPFPLFQY
jgi:hypothetical protein